MKKREPQHEEIDPDDVDDNAVDRAFAELAKRRAITQREPTPGQVPDEVEPVREADLEQRCTKHYADRL